MRRRPLVAAGILVAWLCASSAVAQVSATPSTDPSAKQYEPASAPAVPTRSIVFTPDRERARLELHGIGLVDGIWTHGWIPVCVGRCMGQVPLGEKYRVNGAGIRQSRIFPIGPGPTPLYLQAKTGSAIGYGLGMAQTIVGATALPGGLLMFGMLDICIGDGGQVCPDNSTEKAVSLTVAGLGAIALIAGIVQMVRNKTVVTGDEPREAR
jgi:hypothetical protein